MNYDGIVSEEIPEMTMTPKAEIYNCTKYAVTEVVGIALYVFLSALFSVITIGCTMAFFIGCLFGYFSLCALVASLLNLFIAVGFSRKTIGKTFLPGKLNIKDGGLS